uniref:Toll-like receptor W n=1 Tax=Mytilus galloprovincialis TaxID=29158 RepID=M4VR96_MYTGA|nr:toll-like receptor W precursor [Mytilus galloprovincialis]
MNGHQQLSISVWRKPESSRLMKNLIIVWLVQSYANVVSGRLCPSDPLCQCTLFKQKMDCSDRNITEIPALPAHLIEINFSGNTIKEVPDDVFYNNGLLEILDLSHNLISSLHQRSLYGLVNVKRLLLNNNYISYVHCLTLTALQSLIELNFKMNLYDSLGLNVTGLTLITAKLDFRQPTNMTRKFWSMPTLRNMDVSGVTGICNVTTLTSEVFKLLPKLETINLSACSINYIYIGTFRKLSNLIHLDVSLNRCLKFSGLENITNDLPYTSIKTLNINKIHQANELTTEISIRHFQNLKNTTLETLHIEGNRIQLVESEALLYIPKTMRNVFAADNQFSFGGFIKDVLNISIHFVNVSNMFTPHYPIEKPEICDFPEDRCIRSEDGHKRYLHSLEEEQNNIQPSISIPPNMTKVIYRGCNLRFEIPFLRVSSNKVKFIDASFNIFYSWKGPVKSFNYLEYLDMSNNFCTNVSNNFFLRVPNLKNLYVQNNLLGFVLPKDTDGAILRYVKKLQVINLAYNRIQRLPWKFFKQQRLLRKLNISNNMLNNITFDISHMDHLMYLDISKNRLSSLSQSFRDQLQEKFKQNEKLKVDISGNNFQCICDNVDFVQWVSIYHPHLDNLHLTRCQLKDRTTLDLKEAQYIYDMLRKECSSYTALVIGIAILIAFCGSIVLLGMIYRYRWKIRYLYYIIKSKYHGTIKAPSSTDTREYKYDAFISYDENDSNFVHNNLLHQLERDGGLKLCIHKRDFVPGNDIAANITSSIHVSRKVIIVMSCHFLESYWCMFEYNMARMEGIHTRNGKNVLFFVFYEKLLPEELPLVLYELIQKQSYIEYPNDEHGNVIFWDKIKDAIHA